jgi:hypothetical protein
MATANLTDMSILATDTTFGNRVFCSLMLYCSSTIPSESITSATAQIHAARKNFAANIVSNVQTPNPYKQTFINVVSVNQTVANDATAGGTLVGLGSSQVATAAAACTDTDINNAVAAAFNSLIQNLG